MPEAKLVSNSAYAQLSNSEAPVTAFAKRSPRSCPEISARNSPESRDAGADAHEIRRAKLESTLQRRKRLKN